MYRNHILRTGAFFFALGVLGSAGWAKSLKLVVFGDSLTAGYQLAPGEAFPDQLELALKEKGYQVEVTNASVSGDTTSGGLSRLDWSVGSDADAVIVELGANDMLRGLPPETTKSNISQIVRRLKEKGADVLLTGMMAQRNLGEAYAAQFDGLFKGVADEEGVLFYPFFLKGIALQPDLNQADGMHPNAKGVSVLVDNMLPIVETLLDQAKAE